MKKIVRIVFVCFMLLISTLEAETFTPAEIKIEGLQRVTLTRLLSIIELRDNQPVDEQGIAETIKNIYATGYFRDVKILRDDDILIIQVEEHPAIASIAFSGNRLIKTEDLEKSMQENGVDVGRIFPYGRFELILQSIRSLYAERGRYGAKIQSKANLLDGNRIEIQVDIDEGAPTQISQINVLGNEFFSNQEILSWFLLKQRTKWNGRSQSNKYSRQMLSADLETLRNRYLNAGFAKVQIKETIVNIDNAKQYINIGIYIEEGKRYTIGDLRIAGNLVLPQDELLDALTLQSGDVFSQQDVTTDIQTLTRLLGNEGYGLARINSVYQYDDKEGKINITLYARPGERTYVRHIRFEGNKKSQHSNLRRILPQLEGAYYSSELISVSLSRLRRLSYLQDATVSIEPVSADQVDLLFTVEEAPSGNIAGGLVYSDLSGISLSLDFLDRNFLGRGDSFSTSLSYSATQQLIAFSYTQPYITAEGVSASYSARLRNIDFDEADIVNYGLQSSLLGFTLGYPVSEFERVNYGFTLDFINIETGPEAILEITDYISNYDNSYQDFGLSFGYSFNNLDSGFKPTSGNDISLSLNLKSPLGSATEPFRTRSPYYQARLRQKTFFRLHPTIKELAISLGSRIDYLDNFNTEQALPFYAHYFAGGIGSVRGYRSNSLGPRGTVANNAPSSRSQGGNLRTLFNVELIFPIPRLTSDATGLRTSIFWDIGNVFNTRCPFDLPHCNVPIAYNQLRQSYGLSLRWQIQFIPLTFVFARPINQQEGDLFEEFQFTLGAFF